MHTHVHVCAHYTHTCTNVRTPHVCITCINACIALTTCRHKTNFAPRHLTSHRMTPDHNKLRHVRICMMGAQMRDHTHTRTSAYIYRRMHACMHTYMHATEQHLSNTQTYPHICSHNDMHTYAHACMCGCSAHINAHTRIHAHAYTSPCTHASHHTRTHMHAYMPSINQLHM